MPRPEGTLTDEPPHDHADSSSDSDPVMPIDLSGEQLARVRRIGVLGPEARGPGHDDRLAAVFVEAEIEAESVSAVSLGERTIVMVEVGDGDAGEIVRFLGGISRTNSRGRWSA